MESRRICGHPSVCPFLDMLDFMIYFLVSGLDLIPEINERVFKKGKYRRSLFYVF